ncbi:MAG: BrnA antitoxin family protein [Cypionkella sp.]
MTLRKLNAQAQYHNLAQTLRGLEEDLRWGLDGSVRIPAAWTAIALEPAVPGKTPVTIRVDADVAKFFRAMGRGYLTQMNRVLRAFMEARLAGVVKGAEAAVYEPTAMEQYVMLGAEVVELGIRRNARARLDKDTEEMDVEMDRMILRLKGMERDLGVPEEERISGG